MSEEKVEISKDQLQQILDQNQALLNSQQLMQQQINELAAQSDQGFQPIIKDETDRARTVRVCYVNDKPVIGFKNRGSEARPLYVYERPHPNDPKVRVAYVDLLILGEDEAVTVNFNEFQREADARDMTVKDTKETPWEINQGYVNKKQWTGSEMVETAVRVPVKIQGKTRQFVVNDPAFGDFTVDEQWVNIR